MCNSCFFSLRLLFLTGVLLTQNVSFFWCTFLLPQTNIDVVVQGFFFSFSLLLFLSLRVIVLCPSPSPCLLFTLLISFLCCTCILLPHYSPSLLCLCVYCVGVHQWAGVALPASDWPTGTYKDWLRAVYSERETKGGVGGGGKITPAGWGQGRAECVGVFVLRWQGLNAGEERVRLSVSGVRSS